MAPVTIPSAEAPLQNASTNLVRVFDERGVYGVLAEAQSVYDAFKDKAMVQALNACRISTSKTMDTWDEDFKTQFIAINIFAALSPVALRAILGGTVAHAICTEPSTAWYEADGPGIYVVGVDIVGRSGKFLTRKELETLSGMVDRYCKGYTMVKTLPAAQRNAHPDVALLQRVDAILGPTAKGVDCRYINGEGELRRMRAFGKQLKRRCDATLDPSGDEPQSQSPVYVGCSDNLDQRLRDYANQKNINSLILLTLDMLNIMGLKARLSAKPVLRIWEADQLVIGERIIATLASSLVAQAGFNATQAGGKPSASNRAILTRGKQHVFVDRPDMSANIVTIDTVLQGQLDLDDRLMVLHARCAKLQEQLDKTHNDFRGLQARGRSAWMPEAKVLALIRGKHDEQRRIKMEMEVRDTKEEECEALLRAMLPREVNDECDRLWSESQL